MERAGRTRENAAEGGKSGYRRENGQKVRREPGKQGKTAQRAKNQAIEGETGKSGAKVMKSPENGAICAVLRRKRVHREKTMP